jgi:hypothetical protein
MRQPVVGKRLELGGDRRICQLSMVQKRRESHVKMFLGEGFHRQGLSFTCSVKKRFYHNRLKRFGQRQGLTFVYSAQKFYLFNFSFVTADLGILYIN